jgi:glycosyltransferase involved in cell wall biosynthesis/tetratricopeptide (TPR) repeat protein
MIGGPEPDRRNRSDRRQAGALRGQERRRADPQFPGAGPDRAGAGTTVVEIRAAIRAHMAEGDLEAAREILERELPHRQAPALLFEALLVAARMRDVDLFSRIHPRFVKAVSEGFDRFPADRLAEIEAVFNRSRADDASAAPEALSDGGDHDIDPDRLRAAARRSGADGDVDGLVAALRRLKRTDKLSAGQHRALLRNFRRTGRSAIVDRYADRWLSAFRKGVVTQTGAVNLLWAAERADDMLAVMAASPLEPTTLRNLALRCQKYGEHALALEIWNRLSARTPSVETETAIVDLCLTLGDPITALARAPGALRERAIAAVAEAAIESVVTRDLEGATSAVQALERAAPGHEILRQLRTYLSHLDESAQGAAPAVSAPSPPPRPEGRPRPDEGDVACEAPPSVELLSDAERGDWAVHFSALFLVAREAMAREPELRASIRRLLGRPDIPAGEPGPRIGALCEINPGLALEFALWRMANGDVRGALETCLAGGQAGLSPTNWIEAADAMQAAGREDDAATLLGRACAQAPSLDVLRQAAVRLDRWGRREETVALWRTAVEREDSPRTSLVAARYLYTSGRFVEALSVAGDRIAAAAPYVALSAADQGYLVQLVRLYVQAFWKSGSAESRPVLDCPQTSALACWVSAMFHFARHEREAAVKSLEQALDHPPLADGVPLNLKAELALMHMKFNRYGEARRALSGERAEQFPAHYQENLRRLDKVSRFVDRSDDYLYPEHLIDLIVEESARAPLGYAPVWGHVATVCGSLAAGGGERQAVTAVQRLVSHPSVSGQSLIVRTLEPASNAFFLPVVSTLPIGLVHYGVDWARRTDIAGLHPDLAHRTRLARAVDLLPHNLRENVARVIEVILRVRPEVVHIRQDMYGAALACAIAGVPRYFVHRGSLSRDTWAHSLLQAEVQLRPMVHSYRRLLEATDFFIVNNSAAGRDSDQAWTRMTTDQFVVMPNAVDFDVLGPNPGKNWDLRRAHGIPDDAPVVGGAFRLTPVKRPMLWMQIAALVAAARPDAHFLVIGDGDLRPQVEQFIADAGLANRVHLPGAVADVGAWYRTMDLTLLTSDREGLPNALIESQHFGAPVVSAEVGGAAETMDVGVTGRLVDPNAGAEVFASVILECLEDRAWFENAVKRGQDFVHERFAPEQVVDALVGLYGLPEPAELPARAAGYA